LFLLEILPLIEFQLEDNISDNEALKLIQNSYDEHKPKESEEKPYVDKFILDEENQDHLVDPFTYKLMNFEVKM
jgi:intraflagellar transport protein 122